MYEQVPTADPGPQSQRMSEEEYRRGQTTGQFLQQAADAEEQINHMATSAVHLHQGEQGVSVRRADNLSGVYHSGEWPQSRASRITNQLSRIDGSGIDVDAMRKVDELRDEAERLNKAHDVVTSEGRDVEPVYDEEDIQRRLKGNNSIGSPTHQGVGYTQNLGAMARGAGRKYDIKDGVAMRGVYGGKEDVNGNIPISGDMDSKYKPFAPQHQERAKKAMKSLAEKRMRRANEKARQDEVKAAKAILGRAGVRIPKPKYTDQTEATEAKVA